MSYFKNQLIASLEGIDTKMDIETSREAVYEVNSIIAEVANESATIERIEAIVKELEMQNIAIEQLIEANGRLTEGEAAAFEAARRSAVIALGLSVESYQAERVIDTIGLESMTQNQAVVSLEGAKEILTKIKEAMVKFGKWIVEKFKAFFSKIKAVFKYRSKYFGSTLEKLKAVDETYFNRVCDEMKASKKYQYAANIFTKLLDYKGTELWNASKLYAKASFFLKCLNEHCIIKPEKVLDAAVKAKTLNEITSEVVKIANGGVSNIDGSTVKEDDYITTLSVGDKSYNLIGFKFSLDANRRSALAYTSGVDIADKPIDVDNLPKLNKEALVKLIDVYYKAEIAFNRMIAEFDKHQDTIERFNGIAQRAYTSGIANKQDDEALTRFAWVVDVCTSTVHKAATTGFNITGNLLTTTGDIAKAIHYLINVAEDLKKEEEGDKVEDA